MSYTVKYVNHQDVNDEDAEYTVKVEPFPNMTEEEFQQLCASVLVLIPYRFPEGPSAELFHCNGIWGRLNTPVSSIRDPHGGFIEVLRGGMLRAFKDYADKRPHIKYVVMIDSDEAPEWDAPYRLAYWDFMRERAAFPPGTPQETIDDISRNGAPVMSGVVCAYNAHRGIYACFTSWEPDGKVAFPSFTGTKVLPAYGLQQAYQVGTGLICIRKDVVDSFDCWDKDYRDVPDENVPFLMPHELRKKGVLTGDLFKGEDIIFSEQADARGFRRYVDLSVHATHFKTLPLSWPRDSILPDLTVSDWVINEPSQPNRKV